MAKKVAVDKNIAEIKKFIEEKKLVIGTSAGLKNLKTGKAEKIFLSSNCPDDVKTEVEKLAKISKIPVVVLKQSNEEIGVVCKKPFSISLISVIK